MRFTRYNWHCPTLPPVSSWNRIKSQKSQILCLAISISP